MNTKEFFIEFLAPHVKNIEAEHRHDLPTLDILSTIHTTEQNGAIKIDVSKLPEAVKTSLKNSLEPREQYLNFKIFVEG